MLAPPEKAKHKDALEEGTACLQVVRARALKAIEEAGGDGVLDGSCHDDVPALADLRHVRALSRDEECKRRRNRQVNFARQSRRAECKQTFEETVKRGNTMCARMQASLAESDPEFLVSPLCSQLCKRTFSERVRVRML